jgi:hypothetical protein
MDYNYFRANCFEDLSMSEKDCSVILYHADARKCICKGTGYVGEGINKAFCPIHEVKRLWPQEQEDGSIKFKKIGTYGLDYFNS